jgi:hypothetical protein
MRVDLIFAGGLASVGKEKNQGGPVTMAQAKSTLTASFP